MRQHAAGCPGAGAGYKGLQSPLICGALNATRAPGSARANPGPEDGLGGAPVAGAAPGSGPQATLPRGRRRLEGRLCAQASVPCTRPGLLSATVSASIPLANPRARSRRHGRAPCCAPLAPPRSSQRPQPPPQPEKAEPVSSPLGALIAATGWGARQTGTEVGTWRSPQLRTWPHSLSEKAGSQQQGPSRRPRTSQVRERTSP